MLCSRNVWLSKKKKGKETRRWGRGDTNGSKSLTLFLHARKLHECPSQEYSGEHYAAKQLCDQKNSHTSCGNNVASPFFAAIKIIVKKVILLRAQHNSVLTKSALGVRDWKALTAEKLHRHADNKFWTTLPALPTTEPVHWAARLDVSRHIILTLCHPATKMELGIWRARHHRGFWFIFRTPWLRFSNCSVCDCVRWK